MAFIQKINGKKGPIYKVHYSDPKTGRRRCKSFNRRKDADVFRDSPKANRSASPSKHTVDDLAAHWLHVCKHIGRKGREPIALATRHSYERQLVILTHAVIDGGNLRLGACLASRLDENLCKALRDYLVQEYKRKRPA